MPTATVTLAVPSLEAGTIKQGTGGRGPWTLSIFKASDGRDYTTLDGALASKASYLAGEGLVTIEYAEKPSKDGKYTNYDLKGVEKAEEGAIPTEAAPASSGAKGEFRTKEQILYSTSLGLAINAFGHAGLDPVVQTDDLYQLADEFYAKLQSFA